MGEWSKTVGEFGETTVENFLNLIGWVNLPQKISVDCLKSKEHGEDGSSKHTHGIDFYYSYLSPLADGTRKNIHISSKYTAAPYPNSPSRIFKEYVHDLAMAVDCFKFSQKKSGYYSALKGYKHTDDVGVLFWLSNDENSDDDLRSKVATSNVVLEGAIHSLYLVDNKSVSFIYLALKHAQGRYRDDYISFYYPSTGRNINPLERKNFGKALPVEYINTSVLPLRVQKQNGVTGLVIFSIYPFSGNDLRRLIGLSQELSKSWSGFVEISFPNFNLLTDKDEVSKILSEFSSDSRSDQLVVTSYTNFFTTINQ